ncbi:MAG TPA: hypothetical protein VNA16_07355, partial [Abditibacteriaceae bacterium]|nr:hypothetical protein [Abditibacteriaceae bacterium]
MPQNFLTGAGRLKKPISTGHWMGRLKRLAWHGGAALAAWSTPETNPFLQRALRIETRKHKPLLTALGCLLMVFLVNVIGWWLWGWWLKNGRPWLNPQWPPGIFPPALGSNFMGFIGILTTAVCACAVLYTSRARTAYLLRQEFLKDTLDQLHLLPTVEERWLWMMGAHPLAIALLIGLIGLPVYCLEVFTGQWTVLDVLALFLVFIMLGFSVPAWQPVFWKAQSTRKRRQGFDIKKWRAATARVKADFDPARLTPEQRLEMERRIQRAFIDMEDDATGGTGTAPTDTTSSAPAARRAAVSFGGVGASIPARAVHAGLGWLLFNIFFQVMLSGVAGRGGGGPFAALWSELQAVLPAGVAVLLPAFPLTWPLLLARLLVAPLPFFAFALPPIVLLGPLWVGFSYQKLVSVAASVSNAETFWTMHRARRRRTVAALSWVVTALLVFGYGWHSLMVNGAICALLPGTVAGVNWALAAAWTFVIVAGTIAAGVALETPLTRRVGDTRLEQDAALGAWRAAAQAAVRSLGIAVAAYFVFCWIGGLSGASHAWIGRLLPTLATAAAFLIAALGSGALQSALAGPLRTLWRGLRWLWFCGLALEAVTRVLRGWAVGKPFAFDQAPHVLFSPFVSLFALFREPAWQPEVHFGLLVQAMLGAISFALAVALTIRPAPAAETEGHAILDIVLAPFMAVYRMWRAFWAAVRRLVEHIKRVLGRWEEAILHRGARYDNPVLTAHVRWKLRREHWPAQWLGALALGTALMLLCGGTPLLLFILDK